MAKLSPQFPMFQLRKGDFPDQRTFSSIQSLVQNLRKIYLEIVDKVNRNAVTVVSQASQPTVPSGEMVVWEDTSATTGQPTHHIVFNTGSTTVTFASEEVAP